MEEILIENDGDKSSSDKSIPTKDTKLNKEKEKQNDRYPLIPHKESDHTQICIYLFLFCEILCVIGLVLSVVYVYNPEMENKKKTDCNVTLCWAQGEKCDNNYKLCCAVYNQVELYTNDKYYDIIVKYIFDYSTQITCNSSSICDTMSKSVTCYYDASDPQNTLNIEGNSDATLGLLAITIFSCCIGIPLFFVLIAWCVSHDIRIL
jgi:hypothetical protein